MSATPPNTRLRLAARFGGFTLSVALTTIAGVISIPLLIVVLGNAAWAQIALVQATTQMAAVIVAFGWGATGPAMIAATAPSDRPHHYLQSLRVRAMLFAVVYPFLVVLLTVLLRGEVWTALIGGLAYLLPALGATWYFAGTARPTRLILCDSIPIITGMLVGVGGAAVTGSALVFLGCYAGGALTAVVTSALVIRRDIRGADSGEPPRLAVRTLLWSQRHGVLTAATSSLYVTLPLLAVNIFIPAALPVYALADRLFRYATIAFTPVQQFFQGWVPEDRARMPRRARLAAVAGIALGLVGGAGVALLAPVIAPLLGAGQIHVPLSVSLPLGVAFVGIGTSAVAGYAGLVAVGRQHILSGSTVLGAVVGVPLILIAASLHSLPLVAGAVAVSEICVAAVQLVALERALRKRGNESVGGGLS